jgi:5-methyltetrahydropteroyltriglutamate--homocysteine methyltransferase
LAEWGPKTMGAPSPNREELERRVNAIVKKQAEVGIDIVNNGELTGTVSFLDAVGRMNGVEMVPVKPADDKVFLRGIPDQDMERFPEYYRHNRFVRGSGTHDDLDDGLRGSLPPFRQVCTGPLSAKSTAPLESDIRTLQQAVKGKNVTDAFMCAISPGWLYRCLWNDYYRTDEEFVFAMADALKPSYKAIIDAGLVLQIDDPNIVDCWTWERFSSLDEYHRYIDVRIEALNSALKGLPEERIRVHVCWGSWSGPHTGGLPLKDAIDRIYRVHVGILNIEGAKANHSHEWKVFKDFKLPEGKVLMPGVVDHTSAVVEHPEVIADRLINYANVVGKENVIAGTDCGFRLDPDVNWAKYESMVAGARLASKALWSR